MELPDMVLHGLMLSDIFQCMDLHNANVLINLLSDILPWCAYYKCSYRFYNYIQGAL